MTATANRANWGQSAKIVASAIWECRLLKANINRAILTGPIVASILSLVSPVQALQVQVTPPNPELGDTLSVIIQVDGNGGETPKVSLQQKNYPAFPIGNNRFRALLPTTPLEKPGARVVQVSGDGQVQKLNVQVRDRDFPTQSIWLPPGKDSEGTDAEFDRVDAFKALVTPQKFWDGKLLRPNSGEITTIYGVRRYYNGVFAKDYYHRGVDYAGPYGSPVVAPAAGRVSLVGRESQGFKIHGNVVGIDHGQGVASILMHLSRIDVKEGDFVKAGQVIGALGSTGASTGPHLHWGLYVHGQSVDPVPWRLQGVE
ncbi:MAG: M23 family metallopeptidase [Microcoleus sp. PH2017_40_RAT_O_B]|uniref:M23 family metallopeptidase n=1 Tax=unclassified Microcoleus TaxID=2642155 RepID=UPI001DFFB836|nr:MULTISPECIES: M23 family metallopeptidase [unclassified Microcoleus]TAE57957.1 MAG: M23 family metallopeptidase [Oscillatoriales cyanobacterium]MCC3454012.1 M23 family metallopeptidase [Microcoleus sp. PH2017_08_TRC_O_A]MCC3572541.1 M23 family metallopeptidase [Microcoleus sp. PH2017_34_RAT_O_A]MCC3591827.1 M23 family metallopeptidase [Microcoleus sp. PH2017_28_MFU_U_A]MCC3610203.1 M23 family metallopeptidase [Microcoleus sp. PH2017_40_RAT_O_B]